MKLPRSPCTTLKSKPQTGRNTKTNEVMVILMKMFDTNKNRKSKLYPQQ